MVQVAIFSILVIMCGCCYGKQNELKKSHEYHGNEDVSELPPGYHGNPPVLKSGEGDSQPEPVFDTLASYNLPDFSKVIYDVNLDPAPSATDHTHLTNDSAHYIRRRRSTAYESLRIHVHFDSSIDYLSYDKRSDVKNKVRAAVAFWERALMVKRSTGVPIRLNRQCTTNQAIYMARVRYCPGPCASVTKCGDIQVPLSHLHGCDWWNEDTDEYVNSIDTQPGVVDKDYILYVGAVWSTKCNMQKTVAFAAHCQLERTLDRPVAGYINICPDSVSTSIHKHKELLYTIKHEILHALGFTAGLYAFYRDQSGYPLTERDFRTNKPIRKLSSGLYGWSGRIVQHFLRKDWKVLGMTIRKNVKMIVTPNVVREVRRHFNCSILEGAELEDQGINGTSDTHWEKRVFENEFMTGTYTQNPVVSRISLALMEDTGWYKVHYEVASELEWGRNLGCDFVMKSCYEWIETRSQRNADIHPFCNQPTSRGHAVTDCTRSRNAVAMCNLAEYTRNLPRQYQYFSTIPGVPWHSVARYGGNVMLADYCPYLQEFLWKDEESIKRGSDCTAQVNTPERGENYLLEKYGSQSKCFNHQSAWSMRNCHEQWGPHTGSGCYEYRCSSDTGLTIYVLGRRYSCGYEGHVLEIYHRDRTWLYHGNITCPSCQDACQNQGVRCPPDDPRIYTVPQRRPRIPCSHSTGNTQSYTLSYWTLSLYSFYTISCTLLLGKDL